MEIQTNNGRILGEEKDGFIRFLGIPYGKATTGRRRFTPPRDPDMWFDTLDCTKWHKGTISDPFDEKFKGEDSLRVNVWVPADAGEDIPVMVWLHGGSYLDDGIDTKYAYGDDMLYDMKTLCKDTGCIIVGVNFRTHVCGFLDFSQIIDGYTNNNGLRDIVSALRWVHENIACFGGAPDKVTVFGEGSGGALALALLQIDEAQPYFARIICQDGGMMGYTDLGEAKHRGLIWLDGNMNPTEDVLVAATSESLMRLNGRLNSEFNLHQIDCFYGPVVDGDYLKEYPIRADLSGSGKQLLIGWNKDAADQLFGQIRLGIMYKSRRFLKPVMPYQSESVRETVAGQTPGFPSKSAYSQILTERQYAVPSLLMADANVRGGSGTYVYRLDYVPKALAKKKYGAMASSELPLLFGNAAVMNGIRIDPQEDEESEKIGQQLRRYWGAFARTGVPSEDWTPYDPDRQPTMLIGGSGRMTEHPLGGREKLYLEDNGKLSLGF